MLVGEFGHDQRLHRPAGGGAAHDVGDGGGHGEHGPQGWLMDGQPPERFPEHRQQARGLGPAAAGHQD